MNNQWDLSEFRSFIEETLKQWLVPGVAIASPKKKSDRFPSNKRKIF